MIEKEIKLNNATSEYYGYLVDRVNLNSGKEQIYGTQFSFNEFVQAFPENIKDTTGINARILSIGLSPMIERMNEMTLLHFKINKDQPKKLGIIEPILYKAN